MLGVCHVLDDKPLTPHQSPVSDVQVDHQEDQSSQGSQGH